MDRINSVDAFKLFAMIAVIAIHTTIVPSANSPYEPAYALVNQLSKFAVPFFFVMSGFFWGKKSQTGINIADYTLKACKRLLFLFIAWSVIYLLPYNLSTIVEFGILGPIKVPYWRLLTLSADPLTLIFQGTRAHLWFIMGLVVAMGISGVFVSKGWLKALGVIAVIFFVIGILAKSYAATPVGIDLHFNTRFGPFFGLIFFVTGYGLSKYTPQANWFWPGVGLFILGCFLHTQEISWLHSLYMTDVHEDYVFSTYFMGVGVALAALANHEFFNRPGLAKFGKLSLGIYVIHYIFIDLLEPVDKLVSHPLWEISYIAIVFLLSVFSLKLMARYKLTRQLISTN